MQGMSLAANSPATCSLHSTLRVPTSTGRPTAWQRTTASTTATHFSAAVGRTACGSTATAVGRWGGMTATDSLYMSRNSFASVLAVPVIPASLGYRRNRLCGAS